MHHRHRLAASVADGLSCLVCSAMSVCVCRDVSTCSEGADAAIVAGRCNENAENIQAAIADAEKYVKDNFVFGTWIPAWAGSSLRSRLCVWLS